MKVPGWVRLVLFLVLALLLLNVLMNARHPKTQNVSMRWTDLVVEVKTHSEQVAFVLFVPEQRKVIVHLSSGNKNLVSNWPTPEAAENFRQLVEEKGLRVEAKGPPKGSFLGTLLLAFLPLLLIIVFFIWWMNRMQGGGGKVMSFAKSKVKKHSADGVQVTFKDVAGVDEAVQELREVVDFLMDPKKYHAVGAKVPKGVLLFGPPGTGKTLLARAVAGEAKVPFLTASGSDFVEMFVGVGASRVRDTFEEAKKVAPCIIFMDEIDAVGRHRGSGMGGGHDEREQTLNQLLVELDGFEIREKPIILIAATNRPDILDPALLRPGRFDRQIAVDRPDRNGRLEILKVHTKGKPLHREVDLDVLAAATPGFVGADLANLLNEAALLTARFEKKLIGQEELEEAIMRVIAGPEKKDRLISEEELKIIAFHEIGHALVGHFSEHCDPLHKVTSIGRGLALGLTISLPSEDRFLHSKAKMEDDLAMTLGGRAAEELVFGEEHITSGASNDLERVTASVKNMVMRFGMSKAIGPRVLARNESQPFVGRDFGSGPDHSEMLSQEADKEIERILKAAYERARVILQEHMSDLKNLSQLLMEHETIDRDQFERLLGGESPETVFVKT